MVFVPTVVIFKLKLRMKIKGAKVWLTGASSGIGEALTYELNKRGAELVISARRVEELDRVKINCQFPDKVNVLCLDLGATDKFEELFCEVKNILGGLDLLINNAGISQRSLAVETEMSVFKKLMDINYLGTIALSKTVLPYFIENKKGHIAVTSSLVGVFASPLRSGYAASKHALHGFFDALRAEHYNDNVKVTIVCPGFIQTEVSLNALTADGSQQQTMDKATANGLTAEACAKKYVKAIERDKKEVYIAKWEKVGVYAKRYFPFLYYYLIRRLAVT